MRKETGTGVGRQEWKTDRSQQTGDRRQETSNRRQQTGDSWRHDTGTGYSKFVLKT